MCAFHMTTCYDTAGTSIITIDQHADTSTQNINIISHLFARLLLQGSTAASYSVGGLDLACFQHWLASCTTGMLLLPGECFAQLQQLPAVERQRFVDALAEQGYMQLTATAEGAILVSPSGLRHMQDTLQDALLKALRHNSNAAVHGDASNASSSLQDEDERPQQDKGHHTEQQQLPAAGADGGGSGAGAAAGGSSNRQQQGEDMDTGSSDEQDEAGAGKPGAAAACVPDLPNNKCVRLRLTSKHWPDHGLKGTCRLDKDCTAADKKVTANFKCARDGVGLDLTLKMEACMMREVRRSGNDRRVT